MATSISATTYPPYPQNPAYGLATQDPANSTPVEGANYYVPGRDDVTVAGGPTTNAMAALDAVVAGSSYAGLNQLMQRHAEYFDPFIQKDTIAHPNWWRDRIARGVFPHFSGLTRETRIFRGGLPHMAGLADFKLITDNPADNVCSFDDFNTYGVGWERLTWQGYSRTWGSDPICLDTLMYTPQAQEQLAWTLQVGADFGASIQEVWNRDLYLYQATQRNRGYLMTSEFDGGPSAATFAYNPFVKAADVTDVEAKANLLAGKPFIIVPASVEIEPLNFDTLDLNHQMLSVDCAKGAISNVGGQSIFGLPTSYKDFERFVKGNNHYYECWKEAKPEQLIEGFNLGVKNFQGWAVMEDSNQARFKIGRYIASYDSTAFDDVGDYLDGTAVFVAYYTPPHINNNTANTHSSIITRGVIPENNPEYFKAELAIAPVFMNNVFSNLFELPAPTSLGSSTSFGPRPGLNGNWSWWNQVSRENIKGSTGQFLGEYRIHPKPMNQVFKATAWLYRRCEEQMKSFCPVDNADFAPEVGTSAVVQAVTDLALAGSSAAAKALAAVAANLNGKVVSLTLSEKVKSFSPGTAITFEVGGESLNAFVIESSAAAKYVVAVDPVSLTAPGNGETTGVGYCKDPVDPLVGQLCSWVVGASDASDSDSDLGVYTALVLVSTDEAELA